MRRYISLRSPVGTKVGRSTMLRYQPVILSEGPQVGPVLRPREGVGIERIHTEGVNPHRTDPQILPRQGGHNIQSSLTYN